MPLQFDNTFLRALPGDAEVKNFTRQVSSIAYSRVMPTPVAAPSMLAYSLEMASSLGLTGDDMASHDIINALAGNTL